MKIIFGDHFTGKTTKALKLISGDPNTIYFSLDGDKSIESHIEKSQISQIKNCFLIDIEFAITGKNVKRIVVDPINYIKTVNELNIEKTFKDIIKGLEYLHYTYNIEIIAIYNTLKMCDRTREIINIDLLKSWEIIEVEKFKPTLAG